MVKKRYMVMVLAIVSVMLVSIFNLALAGDVIPSGKPEPKPSDVNVVNFPLDEQGNLKTAIVGKEAFPETLILRGAVVQFTATAASLRYENLLFDADTPFPKIWSQGYVEIWSVNIPTYWQIIYDRRFTYEMFPQKPYFIQGKILASLTYELWQTGGSMGIQGRGAFYLEKIYANGTIETLAEANMPEATLVSYEGLVYEAGFVLSIEDPVRIDLGERIAVRFQVESRNTGTGGNFYFRHHFCLDRDSNDFMITISFST